MTPVTLNTTSWGRTDAPLRALLVHGLGSNGPLMWRFGVTLADAGWHATAVDLRGHGLSPRALDYTIEAHAVDLGATTPEDGAPWDLVIGTRSAAPRRSSPPRRTPSGRAASYSSIPP